MKRMALTIAITALCACGTAAEEPVDLTPPLVILPAEETEEEPENERIEAALLARANKIENCRVTWYCPCAKCNGSNAGQTASGMKPLPGVTCGVDPSVIPLGADVLVDFGDGEIQYLRATDTGVHGNHIDILAASHEEALNLGTTTATVWWVEQ